MPIEHKKIESNDACIDCVVTDCLKKGTSGHIHNCPKDPAQVEYLVAFRLRYNGKWNQ